MTHHANAATIEALETRQRVRLGDIELAYDVAGPANGAVPVLLCMGAVLPGHAWRFVVPELRGERQVAWFDNRGAGASSAPRGPYTIPQLANDAAALLAHLGWTRAHVVGVSLGGMVAQELALAHPARLASLTLIATHPGGLWQRVPPLRSWALLARLALASDENRARAAAPLLFPQAYRQEVGEDWIQGVLGRDFHPPITREGRRGQLAAAMKHDTRARLGALASLPTLVVKPGRDLIIAPRNSDALHRLIPGSRLVTFAEAGHGVIRQYPRELCAALREHFARAESTP